MGKKYVVKKGDTLSKIAANLLGDAEKWREIFEANEAAIDNPDVIQPGTELIIPGKDRGDKYSPE